MTLTLISLRLRLSVLPLVCLLLCAPVARGLVVDFDSSAQFAAYFSALSADGAQEPEFVWSAAAGQDGRAGRIDVLPSAGFGSATLVSGFTVNLTREQPVTASFLFLGSARSGNQTARIGLGLHYEPLTLRDASVQLKTVWTQSRYGSIQGGEGDGALQVGTVEGELVAMQELPLQDDHWYGLTSTWALTEDGLGIRISSSLLDYGTETGSNAFVVMAQLETVVSGINFFEDSGVVKPLYLGLMAQNVSGGALALDRIRISGDIAPSPVPEASVLALVLAGGCMALAGVRVVSRRRRLRQ